ncbi:ATPase, T2SS/T4P/T4SS family [Plesiomonas shigelloides subsp. oncorhynchi]|nr:ATPase, T2SS/T4P/T4SS family [Plesiomonas shigelloides]
MTEGKRNIITIEDPPEFKIEGAVQTVLSHMPGYEDMDKAISAAWAEAMRSIMRLDPDIIMAGEIRMSNRQQVPFVQHEQATKFGAQFTLRMHSVSLTGYVIWVVMPLYR